MMLDAYDRKILFALDKNARESYVQLAKKSGLSKDAVKYRINNYLKNGLLSGFYSLIDSSKLGFYSFRIYVSFKNTTIEDEKKVIEYLILEKNVFYLFRAEGEFDIGMGYFAKSLEGFNEFITKFKEQFSQIQIYKQGIFIYLQHFDRNYLTNKKRLQKPKRVIQEPKDNNIDKTNLEILKLISTNARIQIIDICKKVNLTSKAVLFRLRDLESKGIILGYKPKLNLEKIHYSMYKVDLIIDNKKLIKIMKNYIFQLPNIIHSQEVFGGSDLEFDVECKDYTEFIQIMNKIKENFGNEIKKSFHFRTTKIYKTNFLPEVH